MSALPVVAGALLWAVILYRLAMLRGGDTARSLWLAVASGACAQTADLDAVAAPLRQLTGSADVPRILHALCVISAAGWALNLIQGLREERRQTHVLLGATAAAVAVAGVFAHSPDSVPATFEAQAGAAATSWAWVAYQGALWSYLAWGLVATARFCGHYAHLAAGPLRTGLGLTALGAAVGVTFAALNLVVVLAGLLGASTLIGRVDDITGPVLSTASLCLIGLGYGFEPAARWRQARRSLRRLQPLWSPIATALPYIALPSLGPSLTTQDRLYRRVMEICDGLLVLRGYACTSVRERALALALVRGRPPQQANALAEAVWIATALQAKAADEPATSTSAAPASVGGATFAEEVRWLEQVSAAQADPLFTELVAHPSHRSRGVEVA